MILSSRYRGLSSIPGQEFHMPHVAAHLPQLKIPPATMKIKDPAVQLRLSAVKYINFFFKKKCFKN